MKTSFVLDVDDSGFVRVLQVTQEFTGQGVVYKRAASADSVVCGWPDAKLYGKLDMLLITEEKLKNAAPIEPEREAANGSKLGQ